MTELRSAFLIRARVKHDGVLMKLISQQLQGLWLVLFAIGTSLSWAEGRVYSVESWQPPDVAAHQVKAAALAPKLKAIAPISAMARIMLDAPLVKKDALSSKPGAPTRIGFTRDLTALSKLAQVSSELRFAPLPEGGLVGRFMVVSPNAAATRLGLVIEALPNAAELRFFSADGKQVERVDGQTINTLIESNRVQGLKDPVARRYWSPVIEGDALGLEVYLPKGVSAEGLRFTAPEIAHLAINPAAADLNFVTRAGSASCNLDVNCYSGWSQTRNAIALIVLIRGGGAYLCSGTLLNTTNNSGIPYFLTANHCVTEAAEASTMESYWFYYSTACDSGQRNPGFVRMPGGAELLYHSDLTDASFVKLYGTPPAGVVYAGWTTAAPTTNLASTGLHNPLGDLQKIAFGRVDAFLNCRATTSDQFDCSVATQQNGNSINVIFSGGITEPGSSGSGLFQNDGKLFGQLYGGSSSCSNPAGSNIYGRFDKTFAAGNLAQWLAPSSSQTIAFGPSPALYIGGKVAVHVSATSGLPVMLKSLTPGVCRVSGHDAIGLRLGTCRLEATQAGGNGWAAAQPVTQSSQVRQARKLSVKVVGAGTVHIMPSNVVCSTSCSLKLANGSRVELEAVPRAGTTGVRWLGIRGCATAPTCIFDLTRDRSVRAVMPR